MAKQLRHDSQYLPGQKLTCSKCGFTGTVNPLYILVSYEKDLCSDKTIRDFEYGKAQTWECPKCGHLMGMRGPFTYLNTANRIFLHPTFGRERQGQEEQFKFDITRIFKDNGITLNIAGNGSFSYYGYQARICRDFTDFGEKICIARYGHDDRAMEVVKYYLKNIFLPCEYGTGNLSVMWFQSSGFKLKNGLDGMQFRIKVNGNEFNQNIPAEVYYSAYRALNDIGLITYDNLGFYVDADWAGPVYHKISQKMAKIMTSQEEADYLASKRAAASRPMPRTYTAPAPVSSSYGQSSYDTYETASYSTTSYSYDTPEPNASAQRYNYERAYNEGGSDGYRTATVDGQTVYYTGDYRPFGSEGESYHYDEGMTPMSE